MIKHVSTQVKKDAIVEGLQGAIDNYKKILENLEKDLEEAKKIEIIPNQRSE